MGSIAGQLKDLSCEVLHDGSHIDGGTSSHTLSIVPLAEQTMDTPNGELESSTAGPGLCLSLDFAALASSRHVDRFGVSGILIAASRGSYTLYRLLGAQCWRLVAILPISPGKFKQRTREKIGAPALPLCVLA